MSDRDLEAVIGDVTYLDEVTLSDNHIRGEWAVEVWVDDGRRVLGIRYDGTWVVEPEDAPEAARIFAEAVARMLLHPA